MSAIRRLVANAGVQTVVIVIVKIVGDAGLRVAQVGKHRPLAEFEHLRFEPGPAASKTLSRFSAWVVPGRALS